MGGERKRQSEGVKGRKAPRSPEQTKGEGRHDRGAIAGGWANPNRPRPGRGCSRPAAPGRPLGGSPFSLLLQGPQASVVSGGLYLRSDQSHLLPLLPGPWEVRRCLWVVARWEIGGWAGRLRALREIRGTLQPTPLPGARPAGITGWTAPGVEAREAGAATEDLKAHPQLRPPTLDRLSSGGRDRLEAWASPEPGPPGRCRPGQPRQVSAIPLTLPR